MLRILLVISFLLGGTAMCQGDAKMEKATVEKVHVSTIDVRAHGKYIANVHPILAIDIDTIGVGDVVLIEDVSGKWYVVAVVSRGASNPEDNAAAWVPRPPVSLSHIQVGFIFTLSWDWGDITRRLSHLDHYEVDFKVAGGDWGDGQFPVDVGTAKSYAFDMTPFGKTGFVWRVRAVSIYNMTSEWTEASADFLLDTEAPPAPTNLEIIPGGESFRASWDGPLATNVPDLAGFRIYIATDSSGTGASVWKELGITLECDVPAAAGTYGYFNLVAVDDDGNESDYALDTWEYASIGEVSHGQLLTNADWEAGDISGQTIVQWDYSTYTGAGSPTMAYQSTGGVYNGASLFMSTGFSDDGGFYAQWPGDITQFKVLGVEGEIYTLSFYGSGMVGHYAQIGCSNGVDDIDWTLATLIDTITGEYDGFTRYIYQAKFNPVDSNHKYLAAKFGAYVNGDSAWMNMDRPQLEIGTVATAWGVLAVPPAPTGIRIDASSIISDGIVINEDGQIASDLEPAADDAYWLGSDNNWKGVTLKDTLSATPSGTSGDSLVFVDTDGDLKVRHGTATPNSLQSWFLPFVTYSALPEGCSTEGNIFAATIPRALVVRSWAQFIYVSGTNNASNYWTLTLRSGSTPTVVVDSFDTSGYSPSTNIVYQSGELDVSCPASDLWMRVKIAKTGSPGPIYLPCPAVLVT